MAKQYHIHLKGYVGGWDFSADEIDWILQRHPGEQVNVLVSSLGGSAFESLLISGLFKTHANVAVHYIGVNASAATIASMGAKHISMDADALYLVHNCRIIVDEFKAMTADEIEDYIKNLSSMAEQNKKFDYTVAAMYARRCKKTQAQLLDLMSQERWLSAQEALEWGFIDEITDDADDKRQGPSAVVLAAANLPKLPKSQSSNEFFSRFAEWLRSTFYDHKPNNTYPQMDSFPNVLSAIADAPDTNANGVSAVISGPQLQSLETEIATLKDNCKSLEDKCKSLEDKCKSLEATISEMNKQKADEASTVMQPVASETDDYAAVASRAREMFNAII